MPLWVVWFPWVVPLVGLVACALVVGFSLLFSLVAYARAVGGVLISFLPGVWAWFGFFLARLPVGLYVGLVGCWWSIV